MECVGDQVTVDHFLNFCKFLDFCIFHMHACNLFKIPDFCNF